MVQKTVKHTPTFGNHFFQIQKHGTAMISSLKETLENGIITMLIVSPLKYVELIVFSHALRY